MNIDGDSEEIQESEDLDLSAELGEISADLFGQADGDDPSPEIEDPDGQEGEADLSPSGDTPPAQTEEAGETVEEKPAEEGPEVPSSWSKEAAAEWGNLPPRIKQEILKREQDIFSGIEQYKAKAELGHQYDSVVEPYRAQLAAENINPVELFNAFAGNHYLLSRGSEEQKLSIAANLITHYGINLDTLKERVGQQAAPKDPYVQQLEARLSKFENTFQERDNQAAEAQRASLRTQVEEFAKDKPHFDELAKDITKLISSGVCSTLQEAYDHALWANPTTRMKEQERMTAESLASKARETAEKVQKAKAATSANVNTSAKTVSGTTPVGSMEDTLQETLEKIKTRG